MTPRATVLRAIEAIKDELRQRIDYFTREMFGKDRVRELLARHSDKPAADIVAAVLAGLREFLGEAEPEDDVTLVAIKVLPDPPDGSGS